MDNQSLNHKKEAQKDLSKLTILSFIILILLTLLYSGCKETCDKQLVTYYEPVYAHIEEIRKVAYEEPREIVSPGKIYYKDEFIFINEIDSGIHVIDNTNKSNPITIGFVNIPGNKDLAARGSYMYVDSYMDLVVLDISNKSNISEVKRMEDVFDAYYFYDGFAGLLVDWVEKTEEVEVNCDDQAVTGPIWGNLVDGQIVYDISTSSSSNTGIGGSLARFTITDDYLYTINEYSMKLFDITALDNPMEGNTVDLGWGIETIFPYEDKLFIGARNGMHIYDNSNPELPSHVSTYAHINTCDPVVVQDNYAFVTLRSENNICESFTNQLEVIDISDITNPTQIAVYEMYNPHGLGVNGTCLFIAEGDQGLKVFDITDVTKISDNLIAHHQNVHALDVIPLNDVLFMIGNDGLYQYDYNCGVRFNYLSNIQF